MSRQYVKFIGNGDGVVSDPSVLHLAGTGPDYTLCGLTMDGDQETAGEFEMLSRGPVTCSHCISIIKQCRGVKFKE